MLKYYSSKRNFATAYGQLVVEQDRLLIRSFYLPFVETGFARIGFGLLLITGFVLQFFRDEPRKYFGIVFWGLMILTRLPMLYDTLVRRSYSRRISLNRMTSYEVTDDQHGYQTMVTLHLKNGRYRKLVFRKMENQVEPFTDLLSAYLSIPKLA